MKQWLDTSRAKREPQVFESETEMMHEAFATAAKRQSSKGGEGAAGASTASSSDRIFHEVVRGLYEGRFVPGQRLVEMDLTVEFGVSRSSVREALKRLSSEGIVVQNPHRGAQIRRLSRAETRDILVLLEVLIGLSARLTAERMDDGERCLGFEKSFADLMSFEERVDSYEFVRARNRFYRALVDISGNGELKRVLPGLHVHLLRVQVRSHQMVEGVERFDDYRQIGMAIRERNGRRAELAGRRHVRRVAKALDALPDRVFAGEG